MTSELRFVNIDTSNVDREGFFCYKRKPKELAPLLGGQDT